MARINRSRERMAVLLPRLARAFAGLGYRRATTAEIARRCRTRETTLYRLWPDKKAMFIAAIRYVYELSERTWSAIEGADAARGSIAVRLIDYEAKHHGEFGHYRIIFAGLSEADDPEIRAAMADVFRRFAEFLRKQIERERGRGRSAGRAGTLSPRTAAWAFLGLGTLSNIIRDLKLMNARDRGRLFRDVGLFLLTGAAEESEANRGVRR